MFQQVEFQLVPSTGSYVAAAIAAAAIAATFLTYRAAQGKGATGHRLVLAVMRTAIIGLVLFCLFRPVLVIKAAVPQQNFLGILIDDSRSMQIADLDEAQPRGSFARQQFSGPQSALLRQLSERFVLRE